MPTGRQKDAAQVYLVRSSLKVPICFDDAIVSKVAFDVLAQVSFTNCTVPRPTREEASLMPAYDYRCTACDHVTEIVRPVSAAREPVVCAVCGGPTKRVYTPVGVVFKGSGFHNTDYRKRPTEATKSSASTCDRDGSSPACATCPESKD